MKRRAIAISRAPAATRSRAFRSGSALRPSFPALDNSPDLHLVDRFYVSLSAGASVLVYRDTPRHSVAGCCARFTAQNVRGRLMYGPQSTVPALQNAGSETHWRFDRGSCHALLTRDSEASGDGRRDSAGTLPLQVTDARFPHYCICPARQCAKIRQLLNFWRGSPCPADVN